MSSEFEISLTHVSYVVAHVAEADRVRVLEVAAVAVRDRPLLPGAVAPAHGRVRGRHGARIAKVGRLALQRVEFLQELLARAAVGGARGAEVNRC